MKFIDAKTIRETITYPQLISALRDAFAKQDIETPQRHHHHFRYSHSHDHENTLLLMPAWQMDGYLGVKTVMVAPDNREEPSIQGQYALFDACTGTPKVIMDAASITAMRTAAASALAADYLAPADARTLLMVGTGTLSSELIRAHASVRPIEKVLVWGRSLEKAQRVVDRVSELSLDISVCRDIEEGMAQADIVSCATLSKTPLIYGKWLRPTQHIDLVGAYRPDMREADDLLIKRVALYVDVMPHALTETGDLSLPIESGVITEDSVLGDFLSLTRGSAPAGRTGITCFKSVGHALEDLVAASLVYRELHAEENKSAMETQPL